MQRGNLAITQEAHERSVLKAEPLASVGFLRLWGRPRKGICSLARIVAAGESKPDARSRSNTVPVPWPPHNYPWEKSEELEIGDGEFGLLALGGGREKRERKSTVETPADGNQDMHASRLHAAEHVDTLPACSPPICPFGRAHPPIASRTEKGRSFLSPIDLRPAAHPSTLEKSTEPDSRVSNAGPPSPYNPPPETGDLFVYAT